mgnify:CR=1 FL=1
MSNHHNPDFIQEIMEQDFGTRVLITNPAADRYLEEHKKRKLRQKFDESWFTEDNNGY